MSLTAVARRALRVAARFVFSTALFLSACLGVFAPAAHASVSATILPAGCYAVNGCHYYTVSDVVGYRGDTPQTSCENYAQTAYGWTGPSVKLIAGGGSNGGYFCQVWASNGVYVSGGGVYFAGAWTTARVCPAHSTLDASGSCNCDAGYLPDATQTQCVQALNQIALIGASRTKALVAGPAIVQVAQVSGSAQVSGVAVSIAISNGSSINGTTDANGQFAFTYVPPYKASVDHLTANCGNCTNTAQKDITVDACDVCSPTVGNPIQPATGEKLQTEVDWVDSSAHPLTLVRTYRSYGVAEPSMGLWSTPWSATASVGTSEASLQFGEGQRILFRQAADRSWVADGSADTLVATTTGLQYRRASDGSAYTFDSAGRLAYITQRNGWLMTIVRDGAGRIVSVTNAFGRTLAFAYDAAGRAVSVTLPDGSRVAYGYDAASRLAAATYPDGTTRSYLYENAQYPSALTGIVDERGVRSASFGYDAAGRATTTQHAGAQAYSVGYMQSSAPVGQLVAGNTVDAAIYRTQASVSDPIGTSRTYEWTGGEGRAYLSAAAAPGGISDVASRAGGSMPSVETDFEGVATAYAWDASRRLKTATTQAAGRAEQRTTNTDWHPTFALPVRVTEAGRVTEYGYDEFGNRLWQTISAASGETRTWRWTYANGLVSSMTDPAGAVRKYGYDAQGNRTSQTDPLGRTTSYAFDAAGRIVASTDPGGVQTAYTYDARGRLVSQTVAGETTTFAYGASGQLAKAALPNGYEVTYGYDAADRLVFLADNRGASVTYALDGAGNRVREEVKDANGNIALASSRVIDALGRVAASQGAQGQSTQYGWDANGQPVSTTDPLGQSTVQTLDALRRTTRTTFPDNESARQEWDALDSVTAVTDPKGIRTQYAVNAFGEVTSEASADIGTSTYQRDARGDVIASTDARGMTTRITRDSLGRPTSIQYGDQSQAFAYDAQGNVSRIDDGSGSTAYTRDALGRVLTKTQTVNDSSSPSKYAVQYGYSAGELASVKYPSGLQVAYRRVLGRIAQVDVVAPGKAKTTLAFATNLTYTALGQPKAWNWFNGDTAQRSFDADGRMTASEFASYAWDAASRISAITQQLWVNTGTAIEKRPVSWTVGYDSRSRIASMSRAGQSTNFTYDPNSNRLSKLEISSGELDLEGQFDSAGISLTTSETPRYEATSNRLFGFSITATASDGTQTSTATNDVSYAVDEAGNMTSDGLRKFVYDGANRLSKVEAIKGTDGMAVAYLHNALGQRVFKSDPQVLSTTSIDGKFDSGFIGWLKSNFGWMFAPGQAKSQGGLAFVYDEQGNMLGAYGNGSNLSAQQQIEYIWLPLEDGTSIPIGAVKGGQLYAVHTDHLGTPRLITDATDTPVWQWPYSAFGGNKPSGVLKTVTTTATTAAGTTTSVQLKATSPVIESNLAFPGQYCDSESALCDNWWRSYRPFDGGYPQMDPMGLPAGPNRRIYANDSPLMFSDRLGLQSTDDAPTTGPVIPNPTAAAQQDLINRLNRLFCQQDPDCWDLQQQMEQVANELRQRYVSMTADVSNLFCTRPIGRFSWAGHQMKFNNKQRQLQKLIERAQAKGCSVSGEYIKLAGMDAPTCPTR